MIRITSTGLRVSTNGPVVYLDNWAFIELAEKDPPRRERFINAVRSGIDLLFSVTNAAELAGSQGRSADAVREFLNAIGPRWFPARMDASEAVRLKIEGERPDKACIDELFFKSYVVDQMRHSTGGESITPLSEDCFRLGPLLDRVGSQRDSISRTSAKFDELLKNKMRMVGDKCRRGSALLNSRFPQVPFRPTHPACFVYFNLLRILALDPGSLKAGDGLDFCHTVIACAFSSFATLDKRWKARVAKLPKPSRLARVYSPLELGQMVTDMEAWLANQAA